MQWLFHDEILKNQENKLSRFAATRGLLPREITYGHSSHLNFYYHQGNKAWNVHFGEHRMSDVNAVLQFSWQNSKWWLDMQK